MLQLNNNFYQAIGAIVIFYSDLNTFPVVVSVLILSRFQMMTYLLTPLTRNTRDLFLA